MLERDFEIVNTLGLHARAAAMLVEISKKFSSDVFICKDGIDVNGKSIMGLLMLAAAKGTNIKIRTEGDDSADAMEAIGELVRNGFWEKD
jgi:phosphocarrier protein HPr